MTAVAVLCAMAASAIAVTLVVPTATEARIRAVTGSAAPPRLTATVAAAVVGIGGRIGFGPASRRRRARARLATIESLGALAAELGAGQPPAVALERAAGSPPTWPSALAAQRMQADVAQALRVDAAQRPVLVELAACWQVAAQTGSGLAASVERLARTARRAEEVRGELEAQLAAPRATARLLSALPVIGVGFGVLLGADPVGWLLGSTPGRVCLVVGAGLTLAGAWWTGRIGAAVERML